MGISCKCFPSTFIERGTIESVENSQEKLELKQWPARVVGLRNPWIFLDLLDDGAIRGKLHVSQLGRWKTIVY